MKSFMFAVAVLAGFAVASGCCCATRCAADKDEMITVPDKASYIAIADSTVAAAAQAEKEYEWQIFPAYMSAADGNAAVNMVGIVDGDGYLIWDYAAAEDDFAMIVPVYSREIRKAFAEVKAAVDGSGNGVSNGFACGKNLARAYVFVKLNSGAMIPVDGADEQYFVMGFEFAR